MSIKEALARSSFDVGEITVFSKRLEPRMYYDKRDNTNRLSEYVNQKYNSIVLEKGKALLDSACVSELLREVVAILRPTFDDVELRKPRLVDNGGVLTTVMWGETSHEAWSGVDYRYKLLGVIALPVTDQLVVLGKKEEVLSKDQWSNREFLEDAIVRSCKEPLIMGGHEGLSF